jgi:hypothetical protein
VVAVRMRTAGQPALRRKIFSDGPGMTMPGAAACAHDSARAAAACHPDVVHVMGRRALGTWLHACRTRIGRPGAGIPSSLHFPAHRPASGVHTGSRPVLPDSFRSPVSPVTMLPSAARVCARVQRAAGFSGMDIAERNGVAAEVRASASCEVRSAPHRVGSWYWRHEGFCGLPARAAYVVQCARRQLRLGNLPVCAPPRGWSSPQIASGGANNAGKELC